MFSLGWSTVWGEILVIFAYERKISPLYLLAVGLFFALTIPIRTEAAEAPLSQGETLSLARCLDIAGQKHPQIMAAQQTLDVLKSRVGQSRAGYYPQISWSAGMTRNASPLLPDPFNQYSHSLSLNQNIYDFNRVGMNVAIQRLNLEAALQDRENVTLAIILGVKLAYYDVLRARHAREISADTVRQFEQHLVTAKGFYDVGVKPKFDVTKAEVDLSNARLNLVRAENGLIVAGAVLNNAMGLAAAPPYELEEDVVRQEREWDLNECLKKALLIRPDLQSFLRQREAAEQIIQLTRKDYLPTLSGSANYGWSGEEFPLQRGWNIGANLNFNLFNGFLTKNQVGEAVANLEVFRANEEALRQTIGLQVEQSFANLQSAEKSIATAEVTLRQAAENLLLAQGRYGAGVGSPLEVTDALVAQGNARLTLSGALYDYKIAEASLQRAMGEK